MPARPDQEPTLRRVIGSSLDYSCGHGRGGERGKSANKNKEKKKRITRDQHNTAMSETNFNCTTNRQLSFKYNLLYLGLTELFL